ncbi:uncharacterized protein Dvir_GJ22420 [Drosophila virilis]|uniref:Uncharacterized protein n=2 Tax=Drosophila virilis TaxID=7244 RepID=B4LN10_DROVI|nr:uncharacterized protein Dvir_GJ22420 [Drosophila virilis]
MELGLGIGLIHIVLTLVAMGSAWKNGTLSIVAYSLYLFLNVFLCARLTKGDLYVILLWFTFTSILLFYRIFCIDKYQYWPFYILTNYFMGASLIMMAVVYFVLGSKKFNENAKPVLQTVISDPTTNRTETSTKPATSLTPTVSRPPGWRENLYYAEPMENRARHEYPRLGWLPDLYPDSNGSFDRFMPSAPELSTADSGDNQCNPFDFNCGDNNDTETSCDKHKCCDKDYSCDNAADLGGGCDDGGGADCGCGDNDGGGGNDD